MARVFLAILVCKFARRVLRLFGRGGTNLPGKLALKCCPDVLGRLGKQVHTVIITGTNGKTTSARMLEECYKQAEIIAFSNRSGANLLPGITAQFVENASLFGKMRIQKAIIECDEAAFKLVAPFVDAKVVLVTNVFRDQLDRFGEITHTLNSIRIGLEGSPRATICINADCALLVGMIDKLENPMVYYGTKTKLGGVSSDATRETAPCKNCNTGLTYTYQTYGHLGEYTCPACHWARPELEVALTQVVKQMPQSSDVMLQVGQESFPASINLPGDYNIYNALGVTAASYALGINNKIIAQALCQFKGGFGRMERFALGSTTAQMILVKNPIGASQVLSYLAREEEPFALAICLNDQGADGTDISWIWDVETAAFSGMQEKLVALYCAGTRRDDLALWLKYAAVPEEKIKLAPDMDKLLQELSELSVPVCIMPTYTAMLHLREKLEKSHGLEKFWE